MTKIIELYLKENVDDNITIKPWQDNNSFSIFMRNNYKFHSMNILGTNCILMEVVAELPNIDQLKKHIYQIGKITDFSVVLYCNKISRYRRKSLIKNRIAFVVENGQMYLPFLGLDLKQVKENVDEEVKRFSRSAQIAYLYFLYNRNEVVDINRLAKEVKLNAMSTSRALNELYEARLVTYIIGGKTGRSKYYKRIPDPEYFQKGRAYLKTPVREVIYTKKIPDGSFVAGLSALSDLSMLNPGKKPVYAIQKQELNKNNFEIVENKDLIKDMNLVELEIWNYDPGLFTSNRYVDLLSLFASLKDESDERVKQALEEVLKAESWYLD